MVDDFNRSKEEFPIDLDHHGEYGINTKAYGWVKKLHAEGDGIYGEVEWTEEGAALVQSRAYRGVSPALLGSLDEKGVWNAAGFSSAALTNHPNLKLKSLNSEGNNKMEELMKLLGLHAEASEEDVVNAVQALKDKAKAQVSAQAVDTDAYVPRAEFAAKAAEAEVLKQAVQRIQADRHNDAVQAVCAHAVQTKKLLPAQVDYHKKQLRTAEDVAEFKAYVEGLPTLGLYSEQLPGGTGGAGDKGLFSTKIPARMGVSEDDYAKAEKALREQGLID